mmetsp:Transcript_34163/g.72689  ORF Transcript_34163/g.72689 Transcript_34163/m.72689 type:complete len:1111 (+) Transcript_34163:318-3650(+)
MAPSKSGGRTEVRRVSHGSADDDMDIDGSAGRPTRHYSESVWTWFKKRNGDTLQGALAFVPWVLQQAYFEPGPDGSPEGGLAPGEIVVHRGKGAVVFSDTSGFTKLTEELAKRSNGAELLSLCLQNFFTPLIDLINNYRGDVIKFSGDALSVYFQAVDDTKSEKHNSVVPPHGTYGLPDLGPMATAVLRASACCIEIHKRLHMFDTGIEGVYLCLHIGVGCGNIHILQVGGEIPPGTKVERLEYFIAGPPLEQIRVAEPLARNGETCLSPQAWDYVKDCVIEGRAITEHPQYHLLMRMDESKYTFPTIKHAAMENDNRADKKFRLSELNIIRKYIPSAVFKQIECGTLVYVNEMRNISVIFINGAKLDVMSNDGAKKAQELMVNVQKKCYQHEGTLNKFMIDDKGMLFLLVFGLPPLVHTDDPTRAVLSCFDMVKVFKQLGLAGQFGVTTGRSYCGVCGSARRMEYTVLGDCVNLAARLMGNATEHGILTDEDTKNRCSHEVIFNALAPIKVKGKEGRISVFQPIKKDADTQIGLTRQNTIRFPWYDHPFAGAQVAISNNGSNEMQRNVRQLCSVKTWDGIVKISEMLGGAFNKSMHSSQVVINLNSKVEAKAPEGSPFANGGIVILEGQAGMGKLELAEHSIVHCAHRLHILPIIGTIGPRPGEYARMAVELIRSTLGVFRLLQGCQNLPTDDFQALQKLVSPELHPRLPILRTALNDSGIKEKQQDILENALEVVMSLISKILQTNGILLLLQYEYGTTLFPKDSEDQAVFWNAVAKVTAFVQSEMKNGKAAGRKSLTLLLICPTAEGQDDSPAIKLAKEKNWFLHLSGLKEGIILEYMSNYLNVPDSKLPPPLTHFVTRVTGGNPRHIRETIDQLLLESNLQVVLGANQQPKDVTVKEMDKIDVSSWQHTAMVGNTVCLLEALDPLEAAVLKMSTCFEKTFTLPDLAASTCSRWADATHFDFLRLYKAIQKLVDHNIIDRADDDDFEENNANNANNNANTSGALDAPEGNPPSATNNDLIAKKSPSPRTSKGAFGKTQCFETKNLLIRAVGGAMVLEAQRKSVKRQALIDRALWRDLPAKMEALAKKRSAQHIPWYYEQAFRRMQPP